MHDNLCTECGCCLTVLRLRQAVAYGAWRSTLPARVRRLPVLSWQVGLLLQLLTATIFFLLFAVQVCVL